MQSNYYNLINKNFNNQNSSFVSLNLQNETTDINKQNYLTYNTTLITDKKQHKNNLYKPLTKVFLTKINFILFLFN